MRGFNEALREILTSLNDLLTSLEAQLSGVAVVQLLSGSKFSCCGDDPVRRKDSLRIGGISTFDRISVQLGLDGWHYRWVRTQLTVRLTPNPA